MKPWLVWAVYFLLVAYNLLDVYHTSNAMAIGVEEWNPLLQFTSLNGIIAIKAFWLTALAGLLLVVRDEGKK